MSLPINIETLLSGKVVEGTRVEYKQGWNPKTILRTVCAFANDFENEGSGYLVVGVEEKNGKAKRPVMGFNAESFERVQKEMIGFSKLIQPDYMPRLFLEEVDGKQVLVIWVPAGTLRPYKVPDDVQAKHKNYNYRIRQMSSSIVPNAEQEAELMQLTARIPFDDRPNTFTSIEELDFGLMREHLAKVKSKLHRESANMTLEELATAMHLCEGAAEHLFPKNVGLLMFSENPDKFFPYIQIDVVEFPEGPGAKEFREKTFKGPIQKQLIDALSYIRTNIIKSKVKKYSDRAEADTFFNFPYEAVEEALANAVYHRSYELREPIEVRILPTAIEVISYSGVDPSVHQVDFDRGVVRVRRYRNRRIGMFLKELELTEGRATGIPTIYRILKNNGSPKPIFDADEPNRSYFLTEIPVHPDFEKEEGELVEGLVEGLVERLVEGLAENQKEILKLIQENPKISKKAMSQTVGISTTAIDKNINTLKDKGIINRIGSDKHGHWTINNSNTKMNKPSDIETDGNQLVEESTNRLVEELVEGLVEELAENQKEILKLIQENPNISKKAMSQKIGISTTAIDKNISTLKNKGIIERIGSDRHGHWKIINSQIKLGN